MRPPLKDITLGGMACHPELVEGSRAEAFAHILRQAQHDPFLTISKRGTKRPPRDRVTKQIRPV
jgi:hypothetical protein